MPLAVRRARCIALLAVLCGCSTTESSPAGADFVVDVAGETFVLRLSDPESIRLARERMGGANATFPLGPLRSGNGGFNAPWTWYLDPGETRMVEAAIEVCDGRPSYVEAHQSDFPTYCPWAARVLSER
jgi:hypothetical protein